MKFIYLSVLLSFLLGACNNITEEQKPNVVFFFVDDLGWTDVTCFGSDFYQTPNVDKLAESGVRFTNGYSSCTVCSPTRASIMSGKYPAKINCTDWIEGWKLPFAKLKVPEWTMYMDTAEFTMAEAFQRAGYATAHFGKWHLGEDSIFWPENHGFDINVGGWAKGAPNRKKEKGSNGYFPPFGNPRIKDLPDDSYLTERLANEACQFIVDNKNEPFFLNFWFYNVHTPLQAKPEKIAKYEALMDSTLHQNNPTYAAMVEHMDEAIGKVMAKLEEQGLMKNTIIVFSSDNGGLVGRGKHKVTSNYPLRNGKGHMYEGGIRVPNIIVAPGITKGGVINETPMISMDYFPTLMDLAGIKITDDVRNNLDGKSLAPILLGEEKVDREALYWHYPHYHIEGSKPYSAIRFGDWKLIRFLEKNQYELYNLNEDISETNNLVSTKPEIVAELKEKLFNWYELVGAQMPSENPHFDPKKQHITKFN